jgi:hypothetical protein
VEVLRDLRHVCQLLRVECPVKRVKALKEWHLLQLLLQVSVLVLLLLLLELLPQLLLQMLLPRRRTSLRWRSPARGLAVLRRGCCQGRGRIRRRCRCRGRVRRRGSKVLRR